MMNKKKLVFFIGGLNFGGMERVVFIAEKLLRDKYDTTIVTLYQNSADYVNIDAKLYDLNVPPANSKIKKAIGMILRLRATKKMKKVLKPDIVFSFGMYSNYLNALIHYDEKIVMGIRSYDWLTDPFISPYLDKYIVRRFDSVNSVSKIIAKDAEKYWSIPLEKNRVIYNPYNVNEINRRANEEIDDFDFENDVFYYITMGRLADQKGYNHLLLAFNELSKRVKNVKLIIMGDGDKKDELELMINKLQLSDMVYMIGGKKNPYKYIKKAQCYVLSSHTEGFPNALVEAMSLGKIIVSTNCASGPSEILLDNPEFKIENDNYVVTSNGILTPSFKFNNKYEVRECTPEEKSYSEAMEYVYLNYNDLGLMMQNAKSLVEKFGYNQFEKSLLDELRELE